MKQKATCLGIGYIVGNALQQKLPSLGIQNFFGHFFSTSSLLLSLSSHTPDGPTHSLTQSETSNLRRINIGDKIQEGFRAYWTYIPNITSSNFFEELEELIINLTSNPDKIFAIILQPEFTSGQRRTLGTSFHTSCQPHMDELIQWLQPLIDNFEAQSGGESTGPLSLRTFVSIADITGIPEPEARPISSSPVNVAHIKKVQAETKRAADRTRKATPTLAAIASLESKLDSGLQEMSNAIKTLSPPQPSAPSTPLGVNWTPIIQGLALGVAQSMGATLTFPSTSSSSVTSQADTTPVAESPVEVQQTPSANSAPLESRFNNIESKMSSLQSTINKVEKTQTKFESQLTSLVSSVNSIAKAQTNLTDSVSSLTKTLEAFIKASNPSNGNPSSNGSSTPTSQNSPTAFPLEEITILKEEIANRKFQDWIVTADLESLVNKDGSNSVYMAAWFNGKTFKVYDITDYNMNSNKMLSAFWFDLINMNQGKFAYFHNWAGYDCILSLSALVNLPNFKFEPVINDGQVISIKIKFNNKLLLTIIDSIKILPSSLAKLAKDWKVGTQKDHFPHYFNPLELYGSLNWEGALPAYEYFEPKRTTNLDYQEMEQEFKNRPWNFLLVSRNYIRGDCIALYEILVKFFNTLVSKFPINPLGSLSIPSLAFKTWRTVQLPLLNKDGFKVYDLARTLDSKLREAYLGGIVDVYKPHLEGKGYYYDVNSLYPTAMCKPMPVGIPTPVNLSINQFIEGNFFGYVEATVQAPYPETPGGYIGLLSIKLGGRLICPIGTFSGFFFSEELRFALANGYTLISIKQAISFQKGENTFLDLIQKLNQIKVEAQQNNQPTIRNVAKLLMNSMYGRFGMHTDNIRHTFLDQKELLIALKDYIILDRIDFEAKALISYSLSGFVKNFSSTQLSPNLRKFLRGLPGQTNVAIAAAVTAYSRMIINQYKLDALKLELNIYYSDTDSLVLSGPLPEEYCDSAALGKLKLEHTFKEGIFVMPKVYYLELGNEEKEIVTKCKGYSGKLTKEQYLALLEGKDLDLTITRWDRSLKAGTVQITRGINYTLKSLFNKRDKVIVNGKWIDTKPIKLG